MYRLNFVKFRFVNRQTKIYAMLKCCCIYKGHIIILREFNRPLSTKKNPKSKYSNTVNLPVSSFPLWIKSKQRLDTDRKIEKVFTKNKIGMFCFIYFFVRLIHN